MTQNKMTDVMIDLETLGTSHDALIIQIGAVYFDRETGEIGRGFSATIEPGDYEDKFSIDYDTVRWWLQQSDRARSLVMENPIPLPQALQALIYFIDKDVTLWSHATFDMPILANAFQTLEMKHPVPYRNMRDIRTLMDLANHKSEKPREGVHHNALDDAKFQVEYVAEAFRKLNCDHDSWESAVCCDCGKKYGENY